VTYILGGKAADGTPVSAKYIGNPLAKLALNPPSFGSGNPWSIMAENEAHRCLAKKL